VTRLGAQPNGRARRLVNYSLRSPHLPIALMTVTFLAIGVGLASDYGPSWDELNTVPYGKQTLEAYLSGVSQHDLQGNLRYYGPAYFGAAESLVSAGRLINPLWSAVDLRHFMYFLSLPIALLSLYSLASRWFGRTAALATSLVFATQPLIFGHAFINPKDMPFLAMFSLSIALGTWMAETLGEQKSRLGLSTPVQRVSLNKFSHSVVRQIVTTSRRSRVALIVLLGFAVSLAADLLVIRLFLLPSLLSLVRSAHSQSAWPPINWIFLRLAERASELPAEVYARKAEELYSLASRPIVLLGFVPAICVIFGILRPSLKLVWPRSFGRAQLIAGVAMGLAIAIRVIAPFAGLLVTALAVVRARKYAVAPLVWYWAVATVVAYLTWPYLWGAPLERFWSAFQVMRTFETTSQVLFQGRLFQSADLPWYYVPWIFGIQLTVPALALAVAGVWHSIRQARNKGSAVSALLLPAIWLALPLLAAVFSPTALYDNGRQYIFALPSAFLFAAIAMNSLLQRLRRTLAQVASVALILLPGLIGIFRLHPYEYVYYNDLVGGVRGAYRKYELDYWATSYREALNLLNKTASPKSSVFILGPWENIWEFARPDLELYDPPDSAFDRNRADYIIVTTRANADLDFRTWATEVGAIQVAGATLAYVLQGN